MNFHLGRVKNLEECRAEAAPHHSYTAAQIQRYNPREGYNVQPYWDCYGWEGVPTDAVENNDYHEAPYKGYDVEMCILGPFMSPGFTRYRGWPVDMSLVGPHTSPCDLTAFKATL